MSIITTATIQADLNWSQIDDQTLTHIADIGGVATDNILTNGSGDSLCNMLWHDVITLPSGGSYIIDLQSLTRTIFSKTVVVGFENVKCIAVKNQDENIGAYLNVAASGADGFLSIFDNAAGKAPCHPKCSIVFPNVITGWTVSSTNKKIFLNDVGGSGVIVEIAIIGCSGSG